MPKKAIPTSKSDSDNSNLFSGSAVPLVYSYLIDPMLSGIRKRINEMIPQGNNIIDIACGTGALSICLAISGHNVTGIDFSPAMVRYAQRKADNSGFVNLRFIQADAAKLKMYKNKEFDYSIMSLALHQFSPETRTLVIKEALRISKLLIVADYAFPQPEGFYGKTIRIIERIAGKEHFSAFKAYMDSGGIKGIAKENGLIVKKLQSFGAKVFVIGELHD